MSCKDSQDLIHAYLDGQLDLVRSLEIEQHLQACPACSHAYSNHHAVRSAMRATSLYFKAPTDLQKRVRSAVRKASKAEATPRVLAWRWLSVGAALALVALITWQLRPILMGPSTDDLLSQEIVSSHVRSLRGDHLTDVASSDQHTVKPWFAGKLDFSPPVKDLTSQGFSLVGGRLDYLENRWVAALVYRHRQHLINLFIWPSTQGSDKDEKLTTRQGYNLIHWAQSGMTYWAVSDLNSRELQEFVRLVQDQGSSPTSR